MVTLSLGPSPIGACRGLGRKGHPCSFYSVCSSVILYISDETIISRVSKYSVESDSI